jgi:hypothetical protein
MDKDLEVEHHVNGDVTSPSALLCFLLGYGLTEPVVEWVVTGFRLATRTCKGAVKRVTHLCLGRIICKSYEKSLSLDKITAPCVAVARDRAKETRSTQFGDFRHRYSFPNRC